MYSHSTPYYGPMRAISSNSFDWDSSESEGTRSKPTPLPHMRLWFQILNSMKYIGRHLKNLLSALQQIAMKNLVAKSIPVLHLIRSAP